MIHQGRTAVPFRERRAVMMPTWRSQRMKDVAIAVCTILLVMLFILLPPPSDRRYDKHTAATPFKKNGFSLNNYQNGINGGGGGGENGKTDTPPVEVPYGSTASSNNRQEWKHGRDAWHRSSPHPDNKDHLFHSSDQWMNREALKQAMRRFGRDDPLEGTGKRFGLDAGRGRGEGEREEEEGETKTYHTGLGAHRHKLAFLGMPDSRQQAQDEELVAQIAAMLDAAAALDANANADDDDNQEEKSKSASILAKALEYKSQWEGETQLSKAGVVGYLESRRLNKLRFTAFIVFHKEIFRELYSGLIPTVSQLQHRQDGNTQRAVQVDSSNGPPIPVQSGAPPTTRGEATNVSLALQTGNGKTSIYHHHQHAALNTTQLLLGLQCRSRASQHHQVDVAEFDTITSVAAASTRTPSLVNCSLVPSSSTLSQRRTLIVFVATNRSIAKHYSSELTHGRLLQEWEMPGYNNETESTLHRLNQYGAMLSVFKSNITLPVDPPARRVSMSYFPDVPTDPRRMATMEMPQQWIAFFQYDMKLSDHLFRHIRKWVAQQQTHAALLNMKATLEREVSGAAAAAGGADTVAPSSGKGISPNAQRTSGGTSASRASSPPPCCIFFGTSEHTHYLLHNQLGQQLMKDYNAYFQTAYTLNDLPPWCATDALIVPAVVFNKVMPFLDHIAEVYRHNASHFAKTATQLSTPPASERVKDGNVSSRPDDAFEVNSTPADGGANPNSNGINEKDTDRGHAHEIDADDGDGAGDGDGDGADMDVDEDEDENIDYNDHDGGGGVRAGRIGSTNEKESAVEIMEAAVALAFGIEMIDFLSVGVPLRHLKESELETLRS